MLNVLCEVAIVALVLSFFIKPKTEVVTKIVEGQPDTVVVVKHDTIVCYEPRYIEKTITDTLHITDTIFLREQKHYHEKDFYDIWISGYEPKLDSFRIYPKIEYKTLTNTITKTVEKQGWTLYAGGGIDAFSGVLAPKVSISLATPRKSLITANLGYYGGLYYGFTIQKEINYGR